MLPKEHRLPGKALIRRLFQRGESAYSGNISFRYLENRLSVSRFSLVAGKRVFPRAVDRNRAKRLLREALRLHLTSVRPGYDGVFFYTRKPENMVHFEQVSRDIVAILQRSRLLVDATGFEVSKESLPSSGAE